MKKNYVLTCMIAICFCTTFFSVNATAAPIGSSELVAASNSSDWNKVLDSYDKYVTQYIAVYKKVQAGDMSAYAQMTDLMEKYQKLAKQLEKAQGEMTSAQLTRYMKITQKIGISNIIIV